MDKYPAIHDLEGRDVEFTDNAREQASGTTTAATIAHGGRERILLSMMGPDLTVYHAVISLPSSYLEAKAMAIDSFHHQIMSAGIRVQDLDLKLAIKSLSGEIIWALLRPEQWANIVCNGDELRLGGSGAELEGLQGPDPTVTFVRFLPNNKYTSRTMILPRTLEGLNKIIKEEFRISKEFMLQTFIPGDELKTTIPPLQSLSVIRQLARQRSLGRILVEAI